MLWKKLSKIWSERTTELLYVVLIVAVARYGALVLQFGSLRLSDLDRWVAWVFLPAGVGVIAALVVGTRVFPGVMFGSFLWNLSGHPMPLIDNLLLSLAGARLPT